MLPLYQNCDLGGIALEGLAKERNGGFSQNNLVRLEKKHSCNPKEPCQVYVNQQAILRQLGWICNRVMSRKEPKGAEGGRPSHSQGHGVWFSVLLAQ